MDGNGERPEQEKVKNWVGGRKRSLFPGKFTTGLAKIKIIFNEPEAQ